MVSPRESHKTTNGYSEQKEISAATPIQGPKNVSSDVAPVRPDSNPIENELNLTEGKKQINWMHCRKGGL